MLTHCTHCEVFLLQFHLALSTVHIHTHMGHWVPITLPCRTALCVLVHSKGTVRRTKRRTLARADLSDLNLPDLGLVYTGYLCFATATLTVQGQPLWTLPLSWEHSL